MKRIVSKVSINIVSSSFSTVSCTQQYHFCASRSRASLAATTQNQLDLQNHNTGNNIRWWVMLSGVGDTPHTCISKKSSICLFFCSNTTDYKSIVLFYRCNRIFDHKNIFDLLWYLVSDKNCSHRHTRLIIFFYIRGCTITSRSKLFKKVKNLVTSVE